MHDQVLTGEGRVQKFELGQRTNRGQADEHLVADRDAVARRATQFVEFGEDGAVDFDGHEAVRRDLRGDGHVLSHTTSAVGERHDQLFGRAIQDRSLGVATGNGTARATAAQGRRLDAPIGEDPAYDR